MSAKGSSRAFDDSIVLPDGRVLKTLRDAGNYISELPKRQHHAPEWQTAIEVLMLLVEKGGPTMMARIAIMQALSLRKPSPKAISEPRRKAAKAYRIIR